MGRLVALANKANNVDLHSTLVLMGSTSCRIRRDWKSYLPPGTSSTISWDAYPVTGGHPLAGVVHGR